MAVVQFWLTDSNPITLFNSNKNDRITQAPKKQARWNPIKDFNPDNYLVAKDVAVELGISNVRLTKAMRECGFQRVSRYNIKYFLKTEVKELKESGILDVKIEQKFDFRDLISSTELAEIYNSTPHQRHKIIEASGLKEVMRRSGRVYFEKNKIIPYFEKHKAGLLKFLPRKQKK